MTSASVGPQVQDPNIGLALSGGGYRAAAFHLGTFRKLDQLGLLPHVKTVSTVSGGSIIGACYVLYQGDLQRLEASMTRLLTEVTIDRGAILKGRLNPFKSSFDQLVKAYDEHLYHGRLLNQIPDQPRLVINATDLATGHLWKFYRDRMGLYDFSKGIDDEQWKERLHPTGDLTLSQAVAASSAFPGAFGTLSLSPKKYYPSMQGHVKRISLVDGGVYDNTGLLSLYAERPNYIIGSDAGKPFPVERDASTGALGFLDIKMYQRVVASSMELQTELGKQRIQRLHKDTQGNNAVVFSIERLTPDEEADTQLRTRVLELMKTETRLAPIAAGDVFGLGEHAGNLLHYRLSQWAPELLRPEDRLQVSRT
ncbi:MAG: patatin-like phospholipase family protein [Chloroflexi bacterium]|nr:patatin-like phospholipase family protein [Chloroflexota bacterium]